MLSRGPGSFHEQRLRCGLHYSCCNPGFGHMELLVKSWAKESATAAGMVFPLSRGHIAHLRSGAVAEIRKKFDQDFKEGAVRCGES